MTRIASTLAHNPLTCSETELNIDESAPRNCRPPLCGAGAAVRRAFVLYPLGQLVLPSLTNASLLGGSAFVGWRNYVRAFTTRRSGSALLFTVQIYAVSSRRS